MACLKYVGTKACTAVKRNGVTSYKHLITAGCWNS